jgi:DNA polymerase-3 subunit delta
MTLDELVAELGDEKLRSAYLVAGEEPLLRDDALAALRAAALTGAEAEFNLDRLDAKSITPGILLDTVRTLPVMAPRRLVVIEEPDAKRGVTRGLLDALADLVGELEDGGSVVLVVLSARPDRRSRWVKAFGAALVECDAPTRARDVAAFVRTEADRQGVSLERGVAELLAERIGPQLLMLRQEIAKLGLSVDPGAPVGRATVAAGTLDVADEPIWDLTDAIGEGRCGDALVVLSHQLSAGAPPPVVLGALVSHFRRLLRTGHGAAVSGPPFVRKKLEGQARRFGVRRLRTSLDAIHETDLALKGAGALRPDMALERLVIALSG